MAETFNPYRAWLGVVSDAVPPTHYELLGISPRRADAETVAEAFRRQMSRLNPHIAGEHGAAAQKIAAELANARVVLLTPTTKRSYDAELAARAQSVPSGNILEKPAAQTSAADSLLPPPAGPVNQAQPSATLVTPPTSVQSAVQPPANQPLPQGAAAPVYPNLPQATGYFQPQPYGQGYAPAYPVGAAPQAAQAYPYGQPYAAAPQPVYASPQGYAPQAVPGYPAVQAPMASEPQPQIPIAPISSGGSSALSRNAARKRSSPVPMLIGIAIAGIAVVAGVIYFVKSESEPQTIAGVSSNSVPSQARPNDPRADGPTNGSEKLEPRDPNRFKSGAVSPSTTRKRNPEEKLFVDEPEAKATVDAVDASGNSTKPRISMPEPMAKKEKPAMDKPDSEKAEKSAAPTTAKNPSVPEAPAESPDDKAAIEAALKAARKALADRDLAEVEIQLAQATLVAVSPEMLERVGQLKLLAEYVSQFWDAVHQMLPKLEAAETFEVDGEQISVVEASSELIIIRAAGKNREYKFPKLPSKLAEALAKRWLDKDSAVSLVVLGAFEAVDPKGDRQEARRLFERAQLGGVNAKPLLAELDARQKPAQE